MANIELGDNWSVFQYQHYLDGCWLAVGLNIPIGDWPLGDQDKAEFRKKLSSALQTIGDKVWERCLKAE